MSEIKAHGETPSVFRHGQPKWEDRHGDGQDPGSHCSYCGSITPERAIELMKTPGVQFSGSDWKYGWPHKFYFEIPNPDADKLVEVGSESGTDENGNRYHRPIMGHRKFLHAKFYNVHLADASDEVVKEFGDLSAAVFGIRWQRKDGRIGYAAPKTDSFYGYQLFGEINAEGKPDHSRMRHGADA